MEVKIKNREWVKNAAIIFLAALLVLTFFSNTIMNRSLPEVATAAVQSGSIVAKVRGTGTVAANGVQQVKSKETRTVRAVMVKVGQEVKAGDVLFVLGEGDETELEQAKEQLRQLELSYDTEALSYPIRNYSTQNRALEVAYANWAKAQEEYDYYEKLYHSEAPDSPDNPSETKAEIDRLNAAIDQVKIEISHLEKDLEKGKAEIKPYEEELRKLNDLKLIYEKQQRGDPDAPETPVTPEEIQRQEELVLQQSLTLPMIDDKIYYNLSEYDDAMNERITELKTIRDEYQNELARLSLSNGNPQYKEAFELAQKKLDDAYTAYINAQASLDIAQANDGRTGSQVYLRMLDLEEQMDALNEKIKSLAGEEENTMTAKVSGTVSTIDCTAGDTVLKDGLMCTIEVPDMGHELSFSVTNDQARRLRVGDTATVSNFYWGNEIKATLATIRTDPKNPQTNKLLTFELEGDVTTGSELTISVGQKSANYDIIIPNSAIKSDSNGSFVLAVMAKNSPLGNRYIARRVSVEVLASDDNNSAVVAELGNGDYVITTASAPLNNGDQVRMADS